MPSSNPKTILVVGGSENELGNCLQEVFRHALFRYFNWSMRQLQTCQQALAFLRRNPIPLIISLVRNARWQLEGSATSTGAID